MDVLPQVSNQIINAPYEYITGKLANWSSDAKYIEWAHLLCSQASHSTIVERKWWHYNPAIRDSAYSICPLELNLSKEA